MLFKIDYDRFYDLWSTFKHSEFGFSTLKDASKGIAPSNHYSKQYMEGLLDSSAEVLMELEWTGEFSYWHFTKDKPRGMISRIYKTRYPSVFLLVHSTAIPAGVFMYVSKGRKFSVIQAVKMFMDFERKPLTVRST